MPQTLLSKTHLTTYRDYLKASRAGAGHTALYPGQKLVIDESLGDQSLSSRKKTSFGKSFACTLPL